MIVGLRTRYASPSRSAKSAVLDGEIVCLDRKATRNSMIYFSTVGIRAFARSTCYH
jgi:hypothetical protein